MATVADYYSSKGYTPDTTLTKAHGSDPKSWFMNLNLGLNAAEYSTSYVDYSDHMRKLQQAKRRATDQGLDKWSAEELKAFLKANFPDHVKKMDGSTFQYNGKNYSNPNFEKADKNTLFIVAAGLTQIANYTENSWDRRSKNFANYSTQIDAFNKHRTIVQKLTTGGGTVDQISSILAKEIFNSVSDYDDFITKIGNGNLKENQWFRDKMEAAGLSSWGGDSEEDDLNFNLSPASSAALNAPSQEELAQETLDKSTFGDPTNPDGLTPVKDANGNVVDGEFTDANGKTFYLTDNGEYRDIDGNPYISPDQNTVIKEIESDQESANLAEDVVDQAVQDVAAGADTAANIQTSVLGGDVSTGVAEQLGWEKGTKEVDGKTVTTFTDPRTNTTYDVDPDTGMLTDTDGNTVSTVGSLNFEENDFAQQFTDAANDFLYGSVINEQAAQSLGFTKTDTGYNGPDGVEYTVNSDGNLVNTDNEVVRSDGFLAYQTQLTNANAEYVTSMEGPDGLLSKYEQTFSDYQTDFQPRMDQLDSNISALNQVATDAGDRGYYNQLRDVYFADSMDQVNRNTESSRDAINQMYAKSGMDTNSPAYSSAMVDLQNKRSEAARTARRQAILDSYGLGTQMLTNRTNALNSAQTGIRSGMDALSDLYDVKLEGLGVERDMISTIYEGKKEGAKLGMEGLGVTTGLERDKINANQSQYFKDLDVRTGLNNNTVNTNVTAANTANTADVNATDDYWTGMGWLQTLVDNDFDWRAAGAAIQTQFPDFDTSTLDEKLQVKFGFK